MTHAPDVLQTGTTNPDDLPDNYDTVEILLGIGEGPIKGLQDGLRTLYFNETPLRDGDGNDLFKDVTAELFHGYDDDDPVVFQLGGVSSSQTVNVQLFKDVPVSRTTVHQNLNALEVRIVVSALSHETSDGEVAASVQFTLEYKQHSSDTWLPWGGNSTKTITALVFSPVAYEYRTQINPQTDDFWDIRVTKITKDAGSKDRNTISWESLQECTKGPSTYPNTSLLHVVTRATGQFTQLETVKGVYKGLLCRIPSNYNPYTHTYSGTWDGTFQVDWTNNPFFIVQELVLNDRLGLNAFYPCTIDKFDVYDAAQWADTMVPDGQGGQQPRFTFNAWITDQQPGIDMLNYIAGSAAGRCFDDGNGTIILRVDKDDDAVALFTPENVENGLLNYTYTDLNQRYNDITVQFNNPILNWNEDQRRVKEDDDIVANGRVIFPMQAAGCTDPQEALRRGYYRLTTSLTEVEQVTFRTNRLGACVQPFDVILIADPDMGYAISGRIKSVSEDRLTVFLRDPIHLETGVDYTVNFETASGVLEYPLTGTSTGDVTQFSFATALDATVDALTTFSLGGGSDYGLPKPYRVLKISQAEGSPDKIDILAIEMNRGKWDAIDNAEFDEGFDYSDKKVGKTVLPPANLVVQREDVRHHKKTRTNLQLSWDPSPDPDLDRYRLGYSYNQGAVQFLSETQSTQFLFPNATHGTWKFYLRAVNTLGYVSPAIHTIYDLDEPPALGGRVTGLEANGQGNDTAFVTKDAVFTWRLRSPQPYDLDDEDEEGGSEAQTLDPDFKDFIFQVFDVNTGDKVFEDFVQDSIYNFSYDKNVASGGPRRTFKVQVIQRDIYNRMSLPGFITVSNPSPAAPAITDIRQTKTTLRLKWDHSTESDASGYYLWASTTEGFTPDDSTLIYAGPDTTFDFSDAPAEKVIYFRLAAYDAFDRTSYTLSPEYSGTMPAVTPIEVVSVLPDILDAKNFTGRSVFLTTTQKFYRFTGPSTGFTSSVDGADIQALGSKYDLVSLVSGGSHTIADNKGSCILTAGATVASYALTMPASPFDGQIVSITTDATITAFTLNPNTGQAISGAPTTLAAGSGVSFQFVGGTTNKWFRVI